MSCEKSDSVECYLIYKPVITSNSPVIGGNDIVLSSDSNSNFNDGVYLWTGPNGFTSNEPNPIIENASTDMIGEYTLIYKRGICVSEAVSIAVNVINNNTVICNPNNNTGTFSNQFYPFSYYSIERQITSNEFKLIGSDANSSLRIIFSSDTVPSSGVYSIVDNFGANSQNQVKLNTTIGYVYYSPIDYFAKSGDVLISYTNSGNMYAIFCNVSFYRGTYSSSSFTGSAKITED